MNRHGNVLSGAFGRGGRFTHAGGPKPPVAAIVIGLLVLWGGWSAFYTIQPEQRGVVKRFGAVVDIAEPGLHAKLPFGIDSVQRVATERVLKEEFGFRTVGSAQPSRYADAEFPDESLMLTGDLNMIDAEWVVQYRIAEPIKFLYAMREPVRTLRDLSESVMRRAVGNRLGSEVLTTARVEIADMVRRELQDAMSRYDNGIQIVTVELQDVVPPKAVKPAFNEVNEARQERERMINEATKQANQRIPLARGQANRRIAEAEGYATERINNAHGETARFRAILAEYRHAPEVTRKRLYLETLNQVLPNIAQVLVVQDGQTAPLPLLNLDRKRPTAKQEAQP